jgi:ligand-binding SRPBCC domain-containing protein
MTPPPVTGRAVERRVFVDAPPTAVWAALHDPRLARTVTPELRVGPPTGAWPAAGATRTGTIRIGMLREPATVESLEARPASRFRYRVIAGALQAEWCWSFEARSGGTIVVHSVAGDVGDRWSGFLAGLGGDPLAKATEAHLRGLKTATEAGSR